MIPLFKVTMAPEAAQRVAAVLGSGYVGQGPICEQFEAALQPVLGTPAPPLLVNSCTSAIDLALHLIGVGPGDEVVTTPMTCTATNSPIVTRGARPVWADIDPATGLIDPDDVARKLTRRTKAIIGVDWGGAPCDYMTLRRFGIPVIQDAAHGPSGGARGDYVCWSFQAIKHLTTGDGGALWCPDDGELERARLLRWYGLDRRSKADFRCAQRITEVGYKYQSNDIAAAIGLANLPGLSTRLHAARINAYAYHLAFAGQPYVRETPFCDESSYWLYTLLVPDRAGFIAHLADCGIAASPVHARNDVHPAFHYPSGPLPGVDAFASQNVAIPVGHWLTGADVDAIIQAVVRWTP